MMDFGVDCRAEIEAALRNAADDAGLGRQGHKVEELFFGGNRRDTFGHADPEIDDTAHR